MTSQTTLHRNPNLHVYNAPPGGGDPGRPPGGGDPGHAGLS